MIREYEFYHGVVFTRLLNASASAISVAHYSRESNGTYILKLRERSAGLYVKYCTKRMSPWQFTFLKQHQGEIDRMKAELGEVFLALVCHDDGIVGLSYDELKLIFDHEHGPAEWVSAARGKHQMYTVKGKNGALDFKVGEAEFSRKILNYLAPRNASISGELEDNLSLHALA